MILEDLWDIISREVNYFFYNIHLRQNWKTALLVKKNIYEFLKTQSIDYRLKVTDKIFMNPEPDVKINLYFPKLKFVESIKLWDILCGIGYDNIPKEKTSGVYINILTKEMWEYENSNTY